MGRKQGGILRDGRKGSVVIREEMYNPCKLPIIIQTEERGWDIAAESPGKMPENRRMDGKRRMDKM